MAIQSVKLVAAVVLSLSVVAMTSAGAAQTCSNISCHDGLCVLDGVLNVPLGDVSLAVDNQCRLVLNGIGATGLDGVLQASFVDAKAMQTTFGLPNFSGSIQGTKAIVTAHGVVGGLQNQEISVMEVLNFDGARVKVTASCTTLGVPAYILEIYSGLTLVTRLTTIDPPQVVFAKEDMTLATCGLESNGNPFTSFRLKKPQPITIQVPLGNPSPFVGDYVLIIAVSPQKVPTEMTDIENRFVDAGAVTMAGLFAGPIGPRCTSNASEVRPGLALCSLDNPSTATAAAPLAAVLPSSRAVKVGQDASAFAAFINPNIGPNGTLKNCGIAVKNLPFSGTFRFQTTSTTNALTLVPNTTVDIEPQGIKTFAFTLSASQAVPPTEIALQFGCENSAAAQSIPGVNTFLFSASATPTADIVALAATLNNDGIVTIPGASGTGVFAVATVNVGASAIVTVSTDTGSAALPVSLTLCLTDPVSGQCLAPPGSTVTMQIDANKTPTFGVFVKGNGTVAFNPGSNRVFVRFKNSNGLVVGSTSVAVRSVDVVAAWNTAALNAIRTDKTPPPKASRNLAILHVAIYDSVNGIRQPNAQQFEPYLVKEQGPLGASKEAAASAAAHLVLNTLYPAQQATFDAEYANELAGIQDGTDKTSGIQYGELVAKAVLAARANDGSSAAVPPPSGSGPGFWVPTPPAFAPYLLPQWGFVTPFAMTSSSQFRPPGPHALSSAKWAAEFNEVKAIGPVISVTRTADQTQVANFWADGAGTETPPGHWNSIAQDVAAAQGNALNDTARLFALLNIAMADAAICAWDAKYTFDFWRPVTAIRNGDTDGNPATDPDPTWSPLLVTPPFPDYVSGHSTFSAAAATVLALFYGGDDISFTTASDFLPGVRRSFSSFSAAANEAAASRLYAGIHFRAANEDGLNSGVSIGEWTFTHYLRPKASTGSGDRRSFGSRRNGGAKAEQKVRAAKLELLGMTAEAFNPATNRVFGRFTNSSGEGVGPTSGAVRTQ